MTTITKSFNAVTIQEFVVRAVLNTDPVTGVTTPVLDSGNNPTWSVFGRYFVTGPSGETLVRSGGVSLTAAQQLTLDTFMAAKLTALQTAEGVA